MQAICAGDPLEARAATKAFFNDPKPTYLRIEKKERHLFTKKRLMTSIGKSICLKRGYSVALLTTGNMLQNCSLVSHELEELGISSSLYSFHTVKPLEKECLKEIFAEHKFVITVEEHSRLGGFGSQ